MAAVLEVEDDVFFADLSHQISLLLMDDDEESLSHCSSVNSQVSSFPFLLNHAREFGLTPF